MTKWLLGIGTLLGVLATALMYIYVERLEDRQVSEVYLRLKPELSLSSGDTIEPEMLTVARLPQSFHSLAQVAIRDTAVNREWISGRPVNRDVAAGEFLLHAYFVDQPANRFAASIGKNKRAISIPVSDAATVAFFVEPGSRVDIVGTFTDGSPNQGLTTKTVLQNVRVLAVGSATTRGAYLRQRERGFNTVTVELTPRDAETLILAMNQTTSGLTLLLRNADDDRVIDAPTVSWQEPKS